MIPSIPSSLAGGSLKCCRYFQCTFSELLRNLDSQKEALENWPVQTPSLLEPGPQRGDI